MQQQGKKLLGIGIQELVNASIRSDFDHSGCSYCRFYIWCEGLDRAREIAIERVQDGKHGLIQSIEELFSADDPEFCTQVDGERWVS